MGFISQKSIEQLREAVDLVDLISRYVSLKRAGTTFKGLCPFHDEKTPSFTVNKVSKHYHCFGCGAHGDAVQFLMQYERLDFKQSLEFLAERFGVVLEFEENSSHSKGVPKARLRQLLEEASRFFHILLLYSQEAAGAREHLIERGFSLSFVRQYTLGFSLEKSGVLTKHLSSLGYSAFEMVEAGLLRGEREFFNDRIVFPILDGMGNTIGFSARKWREKTFGGKYINTSETALFKKSTVLFGLFYSKKKMMKDRIVCLVEGQLDALRLIDAGFTYTVATLGTAFGKSHVDLLRAMGIEEVYLAMDQDEAGLKSAEKAGDLLMKRGMTVRVVSFQGAKDPDELIVTSGKNSFFYALAEASHYLEFIVQQAKRKANWAIPQEKAREVKKIAEKIHAWESPILVHESLMQLALLAQVSPSMLNVGDAPLSIARPVETVKNHVAADLLLELDSVRSLIVGKDSDELVRMYRENLFQDDFSNESAKKIFTCVMKKIEESGSVDSITIASEIDIEEESLNLLFSRRVQKEKVLVIARETIQKIKERNWLRKRETIRKKMEDPLLSEEELMDFAREFDEITKASPKACC